MDTTVLPPMVKPPDPAAHLIAEVIIDRLECDVEWVKAFYSSAYRKLNGKNPGVDAILNEIDNWLIEVAWMPRLAPILKQLAEEGYGDEY